MAIIQYPDNFPKIKLQKEYRPVSPLIVSQLQSGRTRRRRGFTAVPVLFNSTITFPNREAAYEFTQWYKDDLKDGVNPFEIDLLTSAGYQKELVAFNEIYREETLTKGAVVFHVSLEIALRPVKRQVE